MSGSGEAKQERANTWEALLRRATRRAEFEDSTLIVLGGPNSGKSSLLKRFSGIVRSTEHPYVADYSYVEVRNRFEEDSDEVLAHMAVWQLATPGRAGLIRTFLRSSGLGRALFVIVLDLSRPWAVGEELDAWLKAIGEATKAILAEGTAEEAKKLKTAQSRYVQTYVDASAREGGGGGQDLAAAAAAEDGKTDPAVPATNFGVPVAVVGSKGDFFSSYLQKGSGAGDRFEFVTRRLRRAALRCGGSLFYTSVAGEGVNVQLLQDYVYHRMYGFELKQPAKVAATVESYGVFVPSGFDSEELIQSVMPAKTPYGDKTPFTEVFPNPNQETKNQRAEEKVKAMKNDKFYKLLQQKLNSGPRAAAPTARGTAGKPDAGSRSHRSHRSARGQPPSRSSRSPTAAEPQKKSAAVRQFFQSLLKSSGKGGAGKGGAGKGSAGTGKPSKSTSGASLKPPSK